MKNIFLAAIILISGCVSSGLNAPSDFSFKGVNITWLGHASFEIKGSSIIYIDPFVLPDDAEKADYILMTHDHLDHCAIKNAEKIQDINKTQVISTFDCVIKMKGRITSLDLGEKISFRNNVSVEVFDAYNINKEYHPKGFGNGYLVTIGGVKIYHAGDTDLIPEFEKLKGRVDVLLLPIGGKFTMNVEEASKAAEIIQPKVVIPMHYNSAKYGIEGIEADPKKLEYKNVVILKPLV
jgi:L-ascorbate metabolism protein UlaG (beta-lactamase superfamily)